MTHLLDALGEQDTRHLDDKCCQVQAECEIRMKPPNLIDGAGFRDHHQCSLTSDITPTQKSVGERLRELRLQRGLSQRELSGPGVSYAYISRIEAGARQPSMKALRTLAKKLGVTPEYLETGSHVTEAEERELRLAEAELRLR